MKKIKRKQIDFGGTNDQYIRGDGALDNLDDFYITLSTESSQYSQFNQTALTCDKTPEEIVNAIKQGRKFIWTLIAGAGSPSYRFDLSTTRGQLTVVRETRYQYNVLLYCYNGKDNKGLDVRFGLTYVSDTNIARITANATYVDNVVEHPKEVLVCEYNISNHTVSKTPEEIYNARQAGKVVICKRNDVIYNLTIAQKSNNTYLIIFTATIATNDPPELSYVWYFNNEWSDSVKSLQNLLVSSGANQNIKTINGNSLLGSGNILTQPDWNQTNPAEGDYIKNKPTIPTHRTINHEQIYDANLGDINIFDGYYFPNAVQDYDGNWYGAVVIGNQVWLGENLRTTHYANGTPIQKGTYAVPEARYYDNPYSEIPFKLRGFLYNFNAVKNGEELSESNNVNIQGPSPNGWHIPSDREWRELTSYINKQIRFRFNNEDDKTAKALASTNYWSNSDTVGSPGHDKHINNATGFNAIPCCTDNSFDVTFHIAQNPPSSTRATFVTMNTQNVNISYTNLSIQYGYGHSVRCVSDLTPIQFRDWYVNTYGSMQHHLPQEIPSVGDGTLTIQKNGTTVDTFSANASADKTINILVPVNASDVNALPSSTKYGASIDLDFDDNYTEVTDTTNKNPANEGWFERSGTDPNYVYTLTEDTTPVSGKTYYKGGTYIITATLKDQDGNTLGSSQVIDLPLESVVVDGQYNSTTQNVELVLKNGHTIAFSVADLVSGLQTEITLANPLSADLLVSGTNNKVFTAADKTKLDNITPDVVWATETNFDSQTNTSDIDFTPQQLADYTNNGKIVKLVRGNAIFTLNWIGTNPLFETTQGANIYYLTYFDTDNKWHYFQKDLALKSEMSVTPGTGTNADKTTIQLKNGTTATVLTTHQDISGKANINGNYPNMTVGIANNLDDKVTSEEPFLFRPSPNFKGALGKSVRINEIKGRSNMWNQLVDTATSNVVLTSGHKYFTNISGTTSIQTGSGNSQAVTGGTDNVIDLTLVFGAGNEPETVEEFKAWLAANVGLKDHYPYDAGSLLSVKLKEFESIGFNQWVEEWEVGSINGTSGINNNTGQGIRSKNYIPVIGGMTYYFRSPADGYGHGKAIHMYDSSLNYLGNQADYVNNRFTLPNECVFIRWASWGGTTYNNDICISLSSSRNSEYQPYWKRTIPFDITKITGINPTTNVRELVFPNGMRSAGSAYDRIYSDGKETKAVVNIGSRAYATDDETTATVITDMTTTFYPLSTPITYTNLQDENGEPIELPLITKASNGGTERILPQNESSMDTIAPILNIEYQLDVEDRIARLEEIVEGYKSGDVFKNARTGFIIDQRGTITDPDTMVSANYYISDRNIDRAFAGILKYEDIVNDDNYVSDNATQGSVNNNAISWIRKNAHCFVGKWNGTQMRLRQLSDTDKSKFTDGTDATSYITNAAAAGSDTYDVWLKFKKDIYYRCFPIIPTGDTTPNEDLQLVVFCKDKPDNPEQWEKFDKNKLIGVYKGYVSNSKAYSISGVQATNNITQTNSKTYARNRGTGFKLVDLQANNIAALLFYGLYSNFNSQAICGSGTYNYTNSAYYPKKTGLCNYLGMTDTDRVNGNGAASPAAANIQAGSGDGIVSINFMSLENWWGDIYEWMDDLQVMQARRPSSVATANPSLYVDDYINDYIANHTGATGAIICIDGVDTLVTPTDITDNIVYAEDDRFVSIRDIDGNIVRVINSRLKAQEGNIAKVSLGAHGDVFPKALGGSYNVNSYCDYGRVHSVGAVARRSAAAADSGGGVAYLYLVYGAGYSDSGIGFRLLFEGTLDNTTIVKDGDVW